MSLPPLYKFLSVTGAKLTLGNNTFRHAKPSDFNDIEDLTLGSIFPEDTKTALEQISAGFDELLLKHVDDPPTCGSPLRDKVMQVQEAIRRNPNVVSIFKAELAKQGIESIYDTDRLVAVSENFIKELNEFMQRFRVFCVTTDLGSKRLWKEYAEDHKGAALRIEGNVDKDSKFQLFRPVSYREKRPPLYDSALDMMEGALFGDQEEARKRAIEKIIFSKTLPWEHECEYRIAVALAEGEEPWDTLRYHPDEITELYLGANMTDADKLDIVGKARILNPYIAIRQATLDKYGTLAFQDA